MKNQFNYKSNKKLKLTIGMIVKNEEAKLRRCLESLKPILSNLDSELIIVDTGSTDRTVSIANEYANKVIETEWKNDFAAARNMSVAQAQGEWYMFVDADEFLDEECANEIVAFFKTNEYKGFNGAMLTLRNYFNADKTSYMDSMVLRFSPINGKALFKGKIHEFIDYSEPIKLFKFLGHHDGYIFEDQEGKQAKHERNLKLLLEEFESDKHNLHLIWHLTIQYLFVHDYYNTIKYTDIGIQSRTINSNTSYLVSFYATKMLALYRQNDWNKITEVYDEFNTLKLPAYFSKIDIHGFAVIAYTALCDYQEAYDAFKKFMSIYDDFLNKNHKTQDLLFREIYFAKLKSRLSTIFLAASTSASELEKYDEALSYIEMFSYDVDDAEHTLENEVTAIKVNINAINNTKQFNKFPSLYKLAKESSNKDLLGILAMYFESCYMKNINCLEIFTAFHEDCLLGKNEDDYLKIFELRYYEITSDEKLNDAIAKFLSRDFVKSAYINDVLYIALKHGIDIAPVLREIDIQDIASYVGVIFHKYPKISLSIKSYIESQTDEFWNTIKGTIFAATLLEQAILIIFEKGKTDDEFCCDRNEFITMLLIYAEKVFSYVKCVYNSSILNDEGIVNISKPYRFAYYFSLAEKHMEAGESEKYISYLRKATDAFELMEGPVGILLEALRDRLAEKLEAKNKINNEFFKYAESVKANIRFLIRKGELDSARQLIVAYRQLNPSDIEIEGILKLLEVNS